MGVLGGVGELKRSHRCRWFWLWVCVGEVVQNSVAVGAADIAHHAFTGAVQRQDVVVGDEVLCLALLAVDDEHGVIIHRLYHYEKR